MTAVIRSSGPRRSANRPSVSTNAPTIACQAGVLSQENARQKTIWCFRKQKQQDWAT